MKNVAVDALRRGSGTTSMPHLHHRLYNPWICKNCGVAYDLFASGNCACPPEHSGDVDSSVASLHKALLAGCKEGHKATHLRSSNGDEALVLRSSYPAQTTAVWIKGPRTSTRSSASWNESSY
jgi:hypothetical protein